MVVAAVLMLLLVGCSGSTSDEPPAATASPDPAATRALLAAAYQNDLPAAQAALDAGADVNAEDESGQSAYLIATSEVGDDPRLLELTLTRGADVQAKDRYDGTGLIRAADRGPVRIIPSLLRAGVDVDHVNRLGWTALLEAIVLGDGGRRHTGVVRLLVAAGADVNLPDGEGTTPLAHARRRGFDGIAAILGGAGGRA